MLDLKRRLSQLLAQRVSSHRSSVLDAHRARMDELLTERAHSASSSGGAATARFKLSRVRARIRLFLASSRAASGLDDAEWEHVVLTCLPSEMVQARQNKDDAISTW